MALKMLARTSEILSKGLLPRTVPDLPRMSTLLLQPKETDCLRRVATKNAAQDCPPEEAYVPKECKRPPSTAKRSAAESYYSTFYYSYYNAKRQSTTE